MPGIEQKVLEVIQDQSRIIRELKQAQKDLIGYIQTIGAAEHEARLTCDLLIMDGQIAADTCWQHVYGLTAKDARYAYQCLNRVIDLQCAAILMQARMLTVEAPQQLTTQVKALEAQQEATKPLAAMQFFMLGNNYQIGSGLFVTNPFVDFGLRDILRKQKLNPPHNRNDDPKAGIQQKQMVIMEMIEQRNHALLEDSRRKLNA